MPLPLNHRTNRFSMGASGLPSAGAAYAVPVELNIETSGGNPMIACAGPAARLLSNVRRDNLTRLVMTCDTCASFLANWALSKLAVPDQRHQHLLKVELRVAEILKNAIDHGPVGGRLQTSSDIAEILLDDALLALGC